MQQLPVCAAFLSTGLCSLPQQEYVQKLPSVQPSSAGEYAATAGLCSLPQQESVQQLPVCAAFLSRRVCSNCRSVQPSSVPVCAAFLNRSMCRNCRLCSLLQQESMQQLLVCAAFLSRKVCSNYRSVQPSSAGECAATTGLCSLPQQESV